VQGVGYPNPNQSHFRSMDIWQAGNTAETVSEGWLGRALKQLPNPPAYHIGGPNETSPLALAGAPLRVPTIASLDDFQLKTASGSGMLEKQEQRALMEGAARPKTSKPPGLLDFVQRTAVNTYPS